CSAASQMNATNVGGRNNAADALFQLTCCRRNDAECRRDWSAVAVTLGEVNESGCVTARVSEFADGDIVANLLTQVVKLAIGHHDERIPPADNRNDMLQKTCPRVVPKDVCHFVTQDGLELVGKQP